jgi:hypothetical protein
MGWMDQPAVGGTAGEAGGQPTPETSLMYGQPVIEEAPPPPRPMWDTGDVAKSTVSGLARGTAGMGDFDTNIASLATRLAEKLTGRDIPELAEKDIASMMPGSRFKPQGKSFTEAATEAMPSVMQYEPTSVLGGYARTGAEFAPGMLFPAGSGGMGTRLMYNVVAPAVASETAGNVAKELFPENESAEAWARLAGAFMGSPLAKGTELLARASTKPTNIDPAIRTLTRNGVSLTAGDIRRDPRTIALEATAPRTAAIREGQPVQFRDAALRKAGVEIPTDGETVFNVLEAARKDAGRTYSTVTNGLDIIPSRLHVSRIRDISGGYGTNVEAGLQSGTIRQVQDAIENSFRTGAPISPKQFGLWRSAVSKATRSSSPTARQYAIDTLKVMDDVVGRSLAQAGRRDDIALLGQARSRYRDILAIEDALHRAGKLGDEGMFTPTNLANALSVQGKEAFMRGRRGELAELARAGRSRLTPPSAVQPYTGSKLGLGVGLAADALASGAGTYLGMKYFPDNPAIAYGLGPAAGTATEVMRRGVGAAGRNIFASKPVQDIMKVTAMNPASRASGLTGPVAGIASGAIGVPIGEREGRKSGGRVGMPHEAAADQLVMAAERAKKGISKGTESLLDMSDNHIAHALEVANRSI